jgi:hypothetical protein
MTLVLETDRPYAIGLVLSCLVHRSHPFGSHKIKDGTRSLQSQSATALNPQFNRVDPNFKFQSLKKAQLKHGKMIYK